MKFTILVIAFASVEAFCPSSASRRSPACFMSNNEPSPAFFMVEDKATNNDFGSAMQMTAYDRFGAPAEKVALGIDINEVLQWLGTKEEIISKLLRDNKGFSRQRAEEEVNKFLLDAEMITAYIRFEKTKEGRDLRAEAEQEMSSPKTLATYAAWIVGGAGFGYVRKTIIEPKYASGEWEEIHISLPFLTPQADTAVVAVQQTVDSLGDAVNTVM